jgi:hypothetical protein
MSRVYLWDSKAAIQVEKKGLTKHFEKNKEHFQGIARKLWAILRDNNDKPQYLKIGDLYEPLVDILKRDSSVEHIFEKCGVPYGGELGATKWMCYFTHYVVEQLYPKLKKFKEE